MIIALIIGGIWLFALGFIYGIFWSNTHSYNNERRDLEEDFDLAEDNDNY